MQWGERGNENNDGQVLGAPRFNEGVIAVLEPDDAGQPMSPLMDPNPAAPEARLDDAPAWPSAPAWSSSFVTAPAESDEALQAEPVETDADDSHVIGSPTALEVFDLRDADEDDEEEEDMDFLYDEDDDDDDLDDDDLDEEFDDDLDDDLLDDDDEDDDF